MTDLGQFLAQHRIDQGKTLEQMQEVTKIRKSYLEAIEAGRLDELPGKFYVRAFLKQYCESLGLKPDEVFVQFAPQMPVDVLDPMRESKVQPRANASPPLRARPNHWMSFVLVIAFPLLIVAVIYYFATSTPNDPDASKIDRVPVTDTQAPAVTQSRTPASVVPAPVAPASPTAVQFRDTVRVGSARADRYDIAATQDGSMEIVITVTKDEAWVGVSAAQKRQKYVFQSKMVSGQSHNETMRESAYLVVGRADAVQLTVNGVDIDLGDEPSPRRLWLELSTNAPTVNEVP
jgi:cytoskeletal protein RodZ